MTFPRFLLFFGLLTAVLGITAFVIESVSPSTVLIPKFWVVFGFLAVLTLIAYAASSAGMKKGGEISIYAIMGGVILKLLFSMVFVLLYLLKFRVNGLNFVVEFFSLYFLFTAFEVYSLLRNLRHQIKR